MKHSIHFKIIILNACNARDQMWPTRQQEEEDVEFLYQLIQIDNTL